MNKKDILIGLIIALVLGFFLSPLASSFPDGLEWVAENDPFKAVRSYATRVIQKLS